jgi:PAS domain S-box-containing protein
MSFSESTMPRKLVKIVLLTSGGALLLTCTTILAYEFLTFRQTTLQQASTLGQLVAANSTAALAFENSEDADEILAALKAAHPVTAASLYNREGMLFSRYPADLPIAAFPAAPEEDGYRFAGSYLVGFQPVVQNESKRLGTLYLKWDMQAMYARFPFYGGSIVFIMTACFLVAAYTLSKTLQQQISRPILALAETARAVSDRRDYSVRAPKQRQDELGLLTDAFNHMLTQIQDQNAALRASEERFRSLALATSQMVWWTNAAGQIVEPLPTWQSYTGQTDQEILEPGGWTKALHPGDTERTVSVWNHAVQTVGPYNVDYRVRRHDGVYRLFTVRGVPVMNRHGTVREWVGTCSDITEHKEAEIRLKTQLSRLELLHRITRAIAERQDLTSIFQVMLGRLEDDLPIDFGCFSAYDPDPERLTVVNIGTQSQIFAALLDLTENSQIPVDQNGLRQCLRGELVYEPDVSSVSLPFPKRFADAGLHSFVAAPLAVDARVFGILIAARRAAHGFSSADCEFLRHLCEHVALATHQANLYSALQQAYDDLRQTQNSVMQQERLRALGQMASGIAHDINNAISPVALYTESLLEREPNLSERARDYLLTIQRAIDDVALTVSRMREFYRKRESQTELAPIDFRRLIQQVLDLTRPRWRDVPQERGVVIELHTELMPALPQVLGVEGEMRDALTNLIFNAVDAMPEGGVLTLRTRAGSTERPQTEGCQSQSVFLEVSDTGAGMDEETRRRCLEPFFTTKGERGTGLGLAMVYGMAQRHGAEIEIESKPQSGTTVRLIFPVSDTATTHVVHSPTPIRQIRALRILIVDDDPLVIKALRDILENDGHLVTVAGGGAAGLEAFEAAQNRGESFGVVITDLGMPYMDGRKVAAAVKAASANTPVILLTGWGQRLSTEGDIPPHVDRVLNKPPKLAELRRALAELVVNRLIAKPSEL